MNFDALLQRFFPAVVCCALGLATYFQASGTTALVGSTISASAPVPTSARPIRGLSRPKAKSGNVILSRNAFDSETGPLDGSKPTEPISNPTEPQETPSEPDSDPLEDPDCDFGRVLLIAYSDDPAWSFASIENKSEGQSKLRRLGDVVSDHELRHIGWNRVWFAKDSGRCQMKVGDKKNASSKRARGARKVPQKKKRSPRRSRRGTKLPKDIANKISKVSDTEFSVERSAVEQILEKQGQLFRRVKMRPVKDGDKVTGLRVSRIGRGTLFDALGVKNGDEIRAINGFDLTNPQKALEAYGRLRTANKLKLTLKRGGSPVTLEFNIQ